MIKDYYAVLGLDRDATDEEIRAAYRQAVKASHPDVAGEDPEKVARFQAVTEAYKVLCDPYLRRKHDQELPIKSYPLRNPTPAKVWREVNEVIMLRSKKVGSFQLALEAARPIALEEDKIIIGFSGHNYRQAAYLDVAADSRQLQNTLSLIMGKEYGFRYIQGDDLEDWERVKLADARIAARAKAPASAATILTGNQTEAQWEELITRMTRAFNEVPRRQLAQSKAAFMLQALCWIHETQQQTAGEGETDATARLLGRAIDRLATMVEVPATVVAVELARMGGGEPGQA